MVLDKVRFIVAEMYNSSGNMKKGKKVKPKQVLKLKLDKPKKIVVENTPTLEEINKAWGKVGTQR